MKKKPKRQCNVKLDMPFEEAVERALGVKPPAGGWKKKRQHAHHARKSRQVA